MILKTISAFLVFASLATAIPVNVSFREASSNDTQSLICGHVHFPGGFDVARITLSSKSSPLTVSTVTDAKGNYCVYIPTEMYCRNFCTEITLQADGNTI